jgi:hypothetical protein
VYPEAFSISGGPQIFQVVGMRDERARPRGARLYSLRSPSHRPEGKAGGVSAML